MRKMSRSSRHKEKYGRSSEVSQDDHYEGTAARTRPFSFDEIMTKRKNKKLHEIVKGDLMEIPGGSIKEKDSDHGSERGNGRNIESSNGVRQNLSEEHVKASYRKKEENTSNKDDYIAKARGKDIRDSETKSKAKLNKDRRTEVKKETNEKIHDRRSDNRRPSSNSENEYGKKHTRELSREKYEKESKAKYHNGVDDKYRDRSCSKKHDLRKGRDLEISGGKERKEFSKSCNEELRPKRRHSRSQEREVRNRRSISPSPMAHKRGSYNRREHWELSSHPVKERLGRQHSDVDKSKITNSSSSNHYKRHSGAASRLGGYSPRKRKTEAAVKTPSPTKRSPEKKSAKWDLAPDRTNNVFPAAVLSNFQSSDLNKTASSNIHEVISATSVASAAVKHFSGVALSVLSTITKVPTDSVQLTQATRPLRRLYMENIPASASEKAVMECLNSCLISSGANHIQGTQPCISCIMHKEKCQALVEFLTPEDASAALSFDGTSFSGSIIKIRRPKDFVEVGTGEPEKSKTVVDAISDVVKDSPHKIFIGGISKMLTCKMLMEIVSAFGPLKAYQFENCKDPDEPFALLEYADQSVTFKACAGLNGMKIGGQVITAVQAIPNASSLECDGNRLFCGIPQHAKALLEKPTQVLKLKNLFDPDNFSSLSITEIEEVSEDVRLECARFGSVKSVNVSKHSAIPISTSKLLEFNDDMASAEAFENLGYDKRNPQTRSIRESTGHEVMVGNSIGDGKPATDVMEDEPCQPGHFDSDTGFQQLECKSISNSQELPRDELDRNVGKVTDDIQINKVRVENKLTSGEELNLGEVSENTLMAGEGSNLQEVKENKIVAGEDSNLEEDSGDAVNAFVDDSMETGPNPIEIGDDEEQDCNLGLIFEPGCVFVEFQRTEASCMAAHCLHGRLFDDRVVVVGYVPLDIYLARFPK